MKDSNYVWMDFITKSRGKKDAKLIASWPNLACKLPVRLEYQT